MIVKDFLERWADDVCIKVFQKPIKEIDVCNGLVHRQTAPVFIMLESNQNYLDYELEYFAVDHGSIIVVCKANKEQERKTIEAHLSGK